MSKAITHMLMPGVVDTALCGHKGVYSNNDYRELINCKNCQKHQDYKSLTKTAPKVWKAKYRPDKKAK